VITPTRRGHRRKILPRTPPEIFRRIFWCIKNFWENFFQYPIKPEVDRKLRQRTFRSAILIIKNTYMLRFEFFCDSNRCYKGHVSKLTEKSSSIDPNKSATVKKIYDSEEFILCILTTCVTPFVTQHNQQSPTPTNRHQLQVANITMFQTSLLSSERVASLISSFLALAVMLKTSCCWGFEAGDN